MSEVRSRRELHASPGILTSGVGYAPGMECLSLLVVNQGGEVHILHFIFSVLVSLCATERSLLLFRGELPSEGIPPIAEIPVDSLAVRRAISDVLREDQLVHVEGIPPSDWKMTPCNMERKK